MSKTDNIHHRSSLAPDLEASAKVSDGHLDKVYEGLRRQKKVPPGSPRSHLERNQRIYAALGHIPQR